MTKLNLGLEKLKGPRLGKDTGTLLATSAGLLILLGSGGVSPSPPGPEPEPPWIPKWALMDILSHSDMPGHAWQVTLIDYVGRRYYCRHTWTQDGQGYLIEGWVPASELEDPLYYKVG